VTPPLAPAAPVDEALEQDVLCTVAEDKLRDEWRRQRDSITESLRRSLANRDEQEANVRDNGNEQATLLDLNGPRREEFIARYRARRLSRVDEARSALDHTPADYTEVMRAVNGLFADEDAIAREFAGESGRERLRAAALEGRTTFLAIAAALADAPYSAVRW
jgi:hypothetical protein